MNNQQNGFTLIETIIGLTIMLIMVTSVSQLFVDNLRVLTLSKARNIGTALANEQIEYLRNLPYDNVKTQNGGIYPPGQIADNQTIKRGNYNFTVKTEVTYVDDIYDGNASGSIAGKPVDLNPADYKKAQVSIYLKSSGQLVSQLTTDIAAKASETASNTGVISVKVIDASGKPVTNANVRITNPAPNPAVDIQTTTDNQGLVTIPNLPLDSSNRYQITASLGGYSTDQTIPDPAGTQIATQLNANVLLQQVTNVTLAIDRTSTLNVHVVDTAGNAIPNLPVTVTGSKQIKTNPIVNKYSLPSTTDISGNISLSSLEWDSYSYSLPNGNYLVSTQPYAPTSLSPNSSQAVTLVVSNNPNHPTVTSIMPERASSGTNPTSVIINGSNLSNATSVKLTKSGESDIVASNVVSSGGNTILSFDLNLQNAEDGNWNIVLTNSNGTVTQVGGFNVAE